MNYGDELKSNGSYSSHFLGLIPGGNAHGIGQGPGRTDQGICAMAELCCQHSGARRQYSCAAAMYSSHRHRVQKGATDLRPNEMENCRQCAKT